MNHLIMSASPGLKGKPKANQDPPWQLYQQFQAVDWTVDQLREHKHDKQLAVACAQYHGDHRRKDNFLCSNVLFVDIDSQRYVNANGQRLLKPEDVPFTDADLKELLASPIVRDHASFVQESSSSASGRRGLHLIFVLDQIITDHQEYEQLVLTLQSRFPQCDPATKDAARMLYGSSKRVHLQQEVTLPLDFLRDLVTPPSETEGARIIQFGTHVALPSYGAAALQGELKTLRATGTGDRNNQLNRSAFSLGQLVAGSTLDAQVVEEQLLGAAVAIGLSEREARRTIKSGMGAGEQAPRTPKLYVTDTAAYSTAEVSEITEAGAGARYARLFRDRLRWVAEDQDVGYWLVWNGLTWESDVTNQRQQFAKQLAGTYLDQLKDPNIDEARKKSLFNFHLQAAKWTVGKNIIKYAASESGMFVYARDLDQHPHLLACKNAIVDLRAGQTVPPNRDDFLTKRSPIEYDPDATCPRWRQFLEEVTGDNRDLVAFLKRWVGYVLTGEVKEQRLTIMHGDGQNGKSTFINLIAALLGELAQKAEFDTFVQHKASRGAGSPREDIMSMVGKRLVYASEGERQRKLNEALVKELTSSETISARHNFGRQHQFEPTFKPVLITNPKPVIEGNDLGIQRRILLLPFTVTIPDHRRDPDLEHKLRSELSGILNWGIEGAVEWYQQGLQPPTIVQVATQEYLDEMDILTEFLDSYYEEDASARLPFKQVYENYQEFCKENGHTPHSRKEFPKLLTRRGYSTFRGTGHVVMVKGLCLMEGIVGGTEVTQVTHSTDLGKAIPLREEDRQDQ